MHMRKRFPRCSALLSGVLAVGVIALTPVAHAQVAATSDASQGADQGVGQGTGQGTDQGGGQGGWTLESLGLTPDENGVIDTSVLGENDPRQGANQGSGQGSTNGTLTLDAVNEETGSDSTNTSSTTVSQDTATDVTNVSDTTNAADAQANTGQNTASENTGSSTVTTGSTNVGLQQVTADNLSTPGSCGEIDYGLSAGSQTGDLILDFDPAADCAGLGGSFQAVNTVTGSGSNNTATISSTQQTLVEIQNDGTIENDIDLMAITGLNDVSQNTGDGSIVTGDANIAATILNFLNATVVDGALWFDVTDIFGDLNGNVIIPEEVLAYLNRRRELLIAASNEETGSESTNTVDVDLTNTQTTELTNTAEVLNDVTIDAITGQNTASQNTGNASVITGNVQTTTNTVTLANLNVVDGSLGLIIVNALNRWLGFLLGSDGVWTPIGHDYSTIVNASNSTTGADSTNTAEVDVTTEDTTVVTNEASVTNDIDLSVITGQNTVTRNTGNATVQTGNANVQATIVNVVNTNIVRGGFFAAIVNVFGNWFGDLFFGSQPLQSLAAGNGTGSSGSGGTTIQASNTTTGSNSENTIDIDASNVSTLLADNTATIENVLTVNADTGNNTASRNTGLGLVDTGDVLAALHARNIANITVAGNASPWGNLTADLLNATTGAESTNEIDVTVNDERETIVFNDATVDTIIGALANTGFNIASRNTLGGLVLTGTAEVIARIENLLNETWLGAAEYGDDPTGEWISVTASNQNTGSGSTNTTALEQTGSTDLNITNAADVQNAGEILATTGNNEASMNTGGGAVDSGPAHIGGAIDNTVNQTTLLGLSGDSLDVDIESAADVINALAASAASGNNDVSRNTGELVRPDAPSAGGPSPSDPEDGHPTVLTGVGGGPTLAVTESACIEGTEVTGEGLPVRPPSRKPAIAAATAVPQQEPPAGAGEFGGGPSWGQGFARNFLGVQEAQARATDNRQIPASVANLSNSRQEIHEARATVWPWVALASAFILGLGSTRRGKALVLRLARPLR